PLHPSTGLLELREARLPARDDPPPAVPLERADALPARAEISAAALASPPLASVPCSRVRSDLESPIFTDDAPAKRSICRSSSDTASRMLPKPPRRESENASQ